ncbi:hypothetical protein H6B32_12225 [Bacteroides gallinaceum]|uniref:hypothetical protein n=1 Tax=Bacteroides gallinaceum TaxID=1462571 RepID=UPI001956F38C|nr:hypothetical protein [Bacteroides gallinaceum]MBM6945932.1 hypothetical protein [Bacteroides gallinaceum]
MCKLTNEQMLRYFIFKDCGFDEELAKKSYDFVMGNEPEPQPESKPATELADGIYLMYGKTAVPYTGQELSENDKHGCTGIGIKFGGKSLVLALTDISDDDVELTTQQGGTRFITDYHRAAEDMDGKTATDDIRDILNMGISDDEYIPSLGELYFILAHFTQINAALEAVGGEPLRNDWYWSSTQYSATNAWRLYLSNGIANLTTKAATQGRVRPVSAFLPLNS